MYKGIDMTDNVWFGKHTITIIIESLSQFSKLNHFFQNIWVKIFPADIHR